MLRHVDSSHSRRIPRVLTRVRSRIDIDARAGDEFPPLTVFWDGEHYWLADGFHRLGANNICMQGLELPGLDIECEVIEGSQRDAIIYACGANAGHGIQRTVPDKQNAVRTMLKNPLVALNEDGVPWSSRRVAAICRVSHTFVDKEKERLQQENLEQEKLQQAKLEQEKLQEEKPQQEKQSQDVSGNVATCISYEQNGKVHTQVRGGGGKSNPPKAEQQAAPEAKPETAPAKTAEVVQFTSPFDYLYDRLSEVTRGGMRSRVADGQMPNSVYYEKNVRVTQSKVASGEFPRCQSYEKIRTASATMLPRQHSCMGRR
jgi:hypothetical protein